MPNVIGKAMKLTKLILMPANTLIASSHSTPTISDPITNGVASPQRNSSSTVSATPANASPDASGPSCSIDAMMSADSAGPPATRAGRPPSATGACAAARSSRTNAVMVSPRHQALAGLG